jgi:hypothetical protein
MERRQAVPPAIPAQSSLSCSSHPRVEGIAERVHLFFPAVHFGGVEMFIVAT